MQYTNKIDLELKCSLNNTIKKLGKKTNRNTVCSQNYNFWLHKNIKTFYYLREQSELTNQPNLNQHERKAKNFDHGLNLDEKSDYNSVKNIRPVDEKIANVIRKPHFLEYSKI